MKTGTGLPGCRREPASAVPSCPLLRVLQARPPGRNAFQVLGLLFKTSHIFSRIASWIPAVFANTLVYM